MSLESYRVLLDRWQLYHPRAQFDISRRKYVAGDPFLNQPPPANAQYNSSVPGQIYVRCNFCNQAVGHEPFGSPKNGKGQVTGAVAPVGVAGLVLGPGKQKVRFTKLQSGFTI